MTLRQAIAAADDIWLYFDEGQLRINKAQANDLRKRYDWVGDWDGGEACPNWSLNGTRLHMHWSAP